MADKPSYKRYKETGICCLFFRNRHRLEDEGSAGRRVRFALPRLFDLSTDSWKSRTLAVLVLLTAFLGPLNILLSSLGFDPLDGDDWVALKNPSGLTPTANLTPDPQQKRGIFTWLQAFWVSYTLVVAMPLLSGTSSQQNLAVTIAATVVSGVLSGFQLYNLCTDLSTDSTLTALRQLTGPDASTSWPYFIHTAIRGIAYTLLTIAVFLAFLGQSIRSIRTHIDDDYDQVRLSRYYDLVQRLITPTRLLLRRAVITDSTTPAAVAKRTKRHSLWRYVRRTILRDKPTSDGEVPVIFSSPRSMSTENRPLLAGTPLRSNRSSSMITPKKSMLRSSASMSSLYGSGGSTPSRFSQRAISPVWTHEDFAAMDGNDDIVDLNDAFDDLHHDGSSSDKGACTKCGGLMRRGLRRFALLAEAKFHDFKEGFIQWMDKKPELPPVHSLFERRGDYHYPARLIMTCATSVLVVTLVAVVYVTKSFIDGMALRKDETPAKQHTLEQTALWTLIASSLIAFSVLVLNWMQMFSSYRSLIFDLRRGRSPFIRTDYSIFYSSSYIGYQMAHSVLGYVVITAITQWSFYGIATLVTSEAARDSAALFMKTTFLTWFVRQVLSWTIFPLIFTEWRGRLVRFQFFFQFLEFFLMFFDALSGIVSSISRLIVGQAIVLLNIGRLDVPIYPAGYHGWDGAYAAFAGMALMDHYTNNPIKLVFIDMLWKSIQRRQMAPDPDAELAVADAGEDRRRRARNKWRLVIMMLRNPSLVQYRKHNLRKKAAEEWKLAEAAAAAAGTST